MTTRDRTDTALSLERTVPRGASYDPAQGPFQNRRIAITGGSSGLGLALVRERGSRKRRVRNDLDAGAGVCGSAGRVRRSGNATGLGIASGMSIGSEPG